MRITKLTKALCFFFLINATYLFSQNNQQWHAGQIAEAFDKLQVVGSVLYIAAHPDDENTRLITYMAHDQKVQTAYLSITRGDGGQNLIGSELREQLGMIRTQELLQARRLDGGRQSFTRANDFGFSKHPDETFHKWDKETILADVVYIIRYFRPDVIITRFNETPGTTHGHHTASAMLAREAFHKAADPDQFPEQLQELSTWQTKRLFWNTSSWFFSRNADFKEEDFISIDVGGYNPQLGISYPEIAANARSMHRSQAFGTATARGETKEYLEQWEGDQVKNHPLEGLDLSWKRLGMGERMSLMIAQAKTAYLSGDIEQSTLILFDLLETVAQCNDKHWMRIKTDEIKMLIKQINGIFIRVYSDVAVWPQASNQKLQYEVVVRNSGLWELSKTNLPELRKDSILNIQLDQNKSEQWIQHIDVPANLPVSQPYWLLQEAADDARYILPGDEYLEIPADNAAFNCEITFRYLDKSITWKSEPVHKETDYVRGELINPLLVGPAVSIHLDSDYLLFPSNESNSVLLEIEAHVDFEGELGLKYPDKWNVSYSQSKIILKKGESTSITVTLKPHADVIEIAEMEFFVSSNGGKLTYSRQMTEINYDHIPRMLFMPKAKLKLIPFAFDKGINKIAYLMGAGDKVAESLLNAGYQVEVLNGELKEAHQLTGFDAVVLGIRYYNTVEKVDKINTLLFDYVKDGGTLITQYNTSYGLKTNELAPYQLSLGRGRITDEFSEVRLLDKSHLLLNFPNKIEQSDFDLWVQERGLYFPATWDKSHFRPIIALIDPDEEWQDGSILYTSYGKGHFIYTGISFFRQLPAGVPGAYRLFANMLSVGKK